MSETVRPGGKDGPRLLVMGAQGSGKGTQARLLVEHFGVPTVSTGSIFRANIADRTELGRMAQKFIVDGELVPDSITDSMVRDRLDEADLRHGFILDGYPRNEHQVEALDVMLAQLHCSLDAVVWLAADREALLKRITRRARVEGRADDTDEAITRRLDLYLSHTAPLISAYSGRGLLVEVDAIGTVDDVFGRVIAGLAQFVAV
jgi:adenylate kinase